jgi:hypothetical protein
MPRLGGISTNSHITVQESSSPTPGATVTIVVTNNENLFTWTAGENETVNISGSHSAGRDITFVITNDGVLPRTITFGTGFVSAGAVVGTISTRSVVSFISNGTDFIQKSTALTGI